MGKGSSTTDSSFLEKKNLEAMREAWDELNPLLHSGPAKYPKSLLDIFDELFIQCVGVWPERFLTSYKE